ncbi:MAG: hybrid sensor histidine kinase/response regulator [Chloroflexi bacterium CFX4]|nr:hybrid sensor histidine kinase/response regulator [Chloroflexi bacterium CFX4]MDL1923636.1 hybrid sensor histidine kinase/response regulator [Chloroflexi bacterium CFX3]
MHTDLAKPRILIIEDDPASQQLLALGLAQTYEVLTASNGADGVELALARRPDLIVCDLAMPIMNGFEVLAALQKNDLLNDVPFIFLTGDTDSLRRGMALGADDYLTKPFEMSELRAVIALRLEKRQKRQALLQNSIEELRRNITMALPHELRTAVGVVQGYTYLMLKDAEKLDPMQREMIEAIEVGAERLRRMADKYLWYLRTHIMHWSDTPSLISHPERLIERKAATIADQFGRRADLQLRLQSAPICISEENLERLIEEVVENAFKFSPEGSSVQIFGGEDQHGYRLSVNNSGRTLTAEQIARIGGFMQFDRQRYEQQGTGLGLIIAKRLAELCGGQLEITSSGQLTSVAIRLPSAQLTAVQGAAEPFYRSA